jgi:hypothetical protein
MRSMQKPLWTVHMLRYSADNVALVGGLAASQVEEEGGDGLGSLVDAVGKLWLAARSNHTCRWRQGLCMPHGYGQHSALALPACRRSILFWARRSSLNFYPHGQSHHFKKVEHEHTRSMSHALTEPSASAATCRDTQSSLCTQM